jgi:hypothetical protein
MWSGVGRMMYEDEYDVPEFDRYTAELLKVMHRRVTRGPLPLPGQYNTVLGTELKPHQIALFASGIVATRALVSLTAKEAMLIPIKSTEIVAHGPGVDRGDHQEGIAYTLSGTDTAWYPGKGIVTWIGGWFD